MLNTDVLSGPDPNVPLLHAAAETGVEPQYATRNATKMYRTTPLRGLSQRPPYFLNGSASDLPAVVMCLPGLIRLPRAPPERY